jgi:molybdopterin synthase catalytic subunit
LDKVVSPLGGGLAGGDSQKEIWVSEVGSQLQDWLDEIKSGSASHRIGVFFAHSGVVRATSRDGSAVCAMELSCNREVLNEVVAAVEDMPGVIAARAWVNEGTLEVGDDIVRALVAGDIRKNVFRAWETLARRIKYEATIQQEIMGFSAGSK